MKIFVGNLAFQATQVDIQGLFESFGEVVSVRIVTEKKSTKSRGFGFVEMSDFQKGSAAIAALNGKDFMGRPLDVSIARPKNELRRGKGNATEPHPKKAEQFSSQNRPEPFHGQNRQDSAKPWQKNRDGFNAKPWKKTEGDSKPWKKPGGEYRPWQKTGGPSKFFKKTGGQF